MFTRNAIALGFLALSTVCPVHADAFLVQTGPSGSASSGYHLQALPSCEQLALGYLASVYAHRLDSPGFVTLLAGELEHPGAAGDLMVHMQGHDYGLPVRVEQYCPSAARIANRPAPPQDEAYGVAWLRQAGASVLARDKLPGVIEQLANRAAFGQDNTQDAPHARPGRYPRRSTRRVGPASS